MRLRSALAGCLALACGGLVVLFIVQIPPTDPARPYDVVIGQVTGDPCATLSPSVFFFDANTHQGRYCGRGKKTGYFTDAEANVVLEGTDHTPWADDPEETKQRLFGAADGVALTKGFDAHPSSGSGAEFIRDLGRITGYSLLGLAALLALVAVARTRRPPRQPARSSRNSSI